MTGISYDVACARYATDQGLDPIGTILTLSGIPWELWQTGGFCMVIHIAHTDPNYYLWLTDENGTGDGPVLIGLYDHRDDHGEPVPTFGSDGYLYETHDQLVDTINEMRHRDPARP